MKGASSQSLKVQWGLETRRDAAADRGARGNRGRGRMALAPLPHLLIFCLLFSLVYLPRGWELEFSLHTAGKGKVETDVSTASLRLTVILGCISALAVWSKQVTFSGQGVQGN